MISKLKKYIGFFKKIGSIYGVGILLLSMMGGCTEDLSEFNESVTDGTVLSLCIPNIDTFETRVEAPKTGQEGKINQLWLFAYPTDDASVEAKGTKRIVNLTDMQYRIDGNYRVYSLNFSPGEYKFYMFSNLDRYLSDDERAYFTTGSEVTGDKLETMTLLFDNDAKKLKEDYLPAAAFPSSQYINGVNSQGYFSIKKDITNRVTINLKFLCSKFRHTILFDNSAEGVSKAFHNNIIEFDIIEGDDKPIATKIKNSTPVKSVSSTTNSGSDLNWSLNLGRYEYPDHNDYPTSSADNLIAWKNPSSWETSGTKAWQYVEYLPENLSNSDEERTGLIHPYTITGVKGKNPHTYTINELRRAQMYDLVTEVVNSDFSKNNIKLTVSDWTHADIMYNLHGPYELIVDKTSINVVRTGGWTVLGFESNVPDEEIGFEYPKIIVDGQEYDFYVAQTVKPGMTEEMIDDEGNPYNFTDGWESHLRIQVNPEIPYDVLKDLNEVEKGGKGEYINSAGTVYKQSDLKYFHVVAANIHKRIDITLLELEIFLNVTPQIITIDTREYYTSGWEDNMIPIYFETNYRSDEGKMGDYFTLSDPDKVFEGKGNENTVLLIEPETPGLLDRNGEPYKINTYKGNLYVNIKDIFGGDSFWNEENEYIMTFLLDLHDGKTLEKEVKIIIKPFTTNYVIHFRDNTRDWAEPHIYVYQLLTLPTDLGKGYDSNGVERDNSKFAGQIVGYIENNNGLQWNGAVQYVFSNNLSFRGWKGYGGPDINNPYDEATQTFNKPSDNNNSNNSTMGFVMFGTAPDNNPKEGCWNYSYAYNYTEGLAENSKRRERYNYNVNFNEDHEKNKDAWSCGTCKTMRGDYNGSNDRRFYTGIAMEREANGWWKYTLSGVAQPGRTMIIFANYHEPWPGGHSIYIPEDNRWPGDYESGLPLFDFEDNEGWFLFDGNTTNSDQKFYDEEPIERIIPHSFTTAYTAKMRIEVKSSSVNTIEVNGETVPSSGNNSTNGVTYFDVENVGVTGSNELKVKINGKEYVLAPKNFRKSGDRYVTADPLYTEFCSDIQMFVKWNDHVTSGGYNPGDNGCSALTVNWGENGTLMKSVPFTGKEYGNYKYVNFTLDDPENSISIKDKIQFKLVNDYSKTMDINDLPRYYNPTKNPFISTNKTGYYQVNVHHMHYDNVY